MNLTKFEGNCPKNVSKDAKYRVRQRGVDEGGGLVVALVYEAENGKRWLPSTDDHPDLVEMVNKVKKHDGNPPNGTFYINEYKQVIVPVKWSPDYYLAGCYDKPLEFEFKGKHLSGDAKDLNGKPIAQCGVWKGPHPGIRYKLCAGGNDISYTKSIKPNEEEDVLLSGEIGPNRARKAASMILKVKGADGGRFYVNERLNAFAPMSDGQTYRYCGKIDLSMWFPKPHADHPLS